MRVLVALVIAGVGAATLGLSPVMAGKNDDPTRFSSAFEAGFVNHGFGHLSIRDVRGDKLRAARCAVPGYRAAYPSKCPALSPKLRRSEARQRALCARSAYRKRHPLFCPRITAAKVDRALKHALEQQPASVTGRWDPNLVQIDGPGHQLDPAAHGQDPVVRVSAEAELRLAGGLPGQLGNEAADQCRPQLGRGLGLRPGHGDERASATRRSTRRPGKPYNIWCSGQVMLRDGRVLVAGGNIAYWTLADRSTRASMRS